MPRFGILRVRCLWCMEPSGGDGGSPSRGGVHQRRLTPSDGRGQPALRFGGVRVVLALCPRRVSTADLDHAKEDARGRAAILRKDVSRCRASAIPGSDAFGAWSPEAVLGGVRVVAECIKGV